MTALGQFSGRLEFSPSTANEVLALKVARTLADAPNAHFYASFAERRGFPAMLSALKTVLDGPPDTRAQRFRELCLNP